jgi:hypothetical protein
MAAALSPWFPRMVPLRCARPRQRLGRKILVTGPKYSMPVFFYTGFPRELVIAKAVLERNDFTRREE